MKARFISVSLRLIGTASLLLTLVTFIFGGFTYRHQTDPLNGAYTISHTVIFSQRPITLGLIGMVLFALSFIVSTKRA